MLNKRQRGMTLFELVLAIVILGIGVAGVMTAFTVVVSRSVDPLVQKQMLAIAEGMMEEIVLLPFAAEGAAPANGPGPCGARSAFNDVLDYHNLQTVGGVCTVDGTVVPNLASYNVGVQINQNGSLATVSGTGSLTGAHVYEITVTVTHGADSFRLHGWRTNYANGLL
ncbi:type II secretion system protein [Noviherbaspirillum aerium]|uniref:type II secretion system protein n=1 Tax=Noviherbaspirillum aerium TaxID=2588497 RepID=UPI00124F4D25|nr:type II secretion system protein [Noviherbaspirillum aerium]